MLHCRCPQRCQPASQPADTRRATSFHPSSTTAAANTCCRPCPPVAVVIVAPAGIGVAPPVVVPAGLQKRKSALRTQRSAAWGWVHAAAHVVAVGSSSRQTVLSRGRPARAAACHKRLQQSRTPGATAAGRQAQGLQTHANSPAVAAVPSTAVIPAAVHTPKACACLHLARAQKHPGLDEASSYTGEWCKVEASCRAAPSLPTKAGQVLLVSCCSCCPLPKVALYPTAALHPPAISAAVVGVGCPVIPSADRPAERLICQRFQAGLQAGAELCPAREAAGDAA